MSCPRRPRASLIGGALGGTVKELRNITIGRADIERYLVSASKTKGSLLGISSYSVSPKEDGREAVVSVTAQAEILVASAKP